MRSEEETSHPSLMTDLAKSGLIMIFREKRTTNTTFNISIFLQKMTGSVEELRVSSDSLESRPCWEDSLQISGDSLGIKV